MNGTLDEYIAAFENTTAANNLRWKEFDSCADSMPSLKSHRDWVESNSWGFGDRAFHYMWYLLMRDDILLRSDPRMLEIGVYKGQIISLWSLIAKQAQKTVSVYAVSPLRGNVPPSGWGLGRAQLLLSQRYRRKQQAGNLYKRLDYFSCIQGIFAEFDLDLNTVRLIKGYSQDDRVKRAIGDTNFDVVYIDGGHLYEEVSHDIQYYGDKVKLGGYLVMDDAAYFLPGDVFWKGRESVALAAQNIHESMFENVLNVGHNRVYKRIG